MLPSSSSSSHFSSHFRRRVRRFFSLALLTAAALVSTTSAAPAGDAAPGEAPAEKAPAVRFEPHRFEPKSGDAVEAELGTFTVPENRERPGGRSIELSFVRFPSTSKTPGSPIVYLAGGPGGSGIETARYGRFPLFMALRAHADVLAFDQRGTGLSNHIPPCAFTETPPIGRPSERGWVGEHLQRQARHCRDFWAAEGVDLGGYDTAQSADDLEDLRRALGVPKLSLWSISYGTHLAFAALARHPESFDRVILASAEGPDETIKLPARTDAFLERVDARTDADLVADLRRVMARLEKEPAKASFTPPGSDSPVEIGIGKLDVQVVVGYLIKNPSSLEHLVPMAAAMAAGDFTAIAPIVARIHAGSNDFGGMSEAMDAASGISPERRRKVIEQRQTAILGDALNFPMLPDWDLAGWLGIEPLPEDFRRAPKSSVPALFLSGSLDGRTYTESHRELAAGFENATFVLLDGAGHDLFMSSPEVETRILDFLARGKTSGETIKVPSFLDP